MVEPGSLHLLDSCCKALRPQSTGTAHAQLYHSCAMAPVALSPSGHLGLLVGEPSFGGNFTCPNHSSLCVTIVSMGMRSVIPAPPHMLGSLLGHLGSSCESPWLVFPNLDAWVAHAADPVPLDDLQQCLSNMNINLLTLTPGIALETNSGFAVPLTFLGLQLSGVPLNIVPNEFLDFEHQHLCCSTHQALFQPADGLCIDGPCKTMYLAPVDVTVRNRQVCLPPQPRLSHLFQALCIPFQSHTVN
eukprot:gene8448-biopygen1364